MQVLYLLPYCNATTAPTKINPIKSLIIPGINMLKPPAQIINLKIKVTGLNKYPFKATATPKIPNNAVAQIKII